MFFSSNSNYVDFSNPAGNVAVTNISLKTIANQIIAKPWSCFINFEKMALNLAPFPALGILIDAFYFPKKKVSDYLLQMYLCFVFCNFCFSTIIFVLFLLLFFYQIWRTKKSKSINICGNFCRIIVFFITKNHVFVLVANIFYLNV